MILTGPAIRAAIDRGDIEIDPFNPEHVNPASVDLTLGDEVLVYSRCGEPHLLLDAKKDNPTCVILINGWLDIQPGHLYLMHTVERVRAARFVPILDGKSSLGRLGVSVHQTAGYGDPGFDGQYTMEVTCVLPVRLYAGMRVAQIRFHAVQGEIEMYRGNYVGEAASGVVASRSWRQFK